MAGQPITLTLPANGDPNPTASNKILTALTTLEVELERAVVPADMNISADLSFLSGATYSRAKDLMATSYALQSVALNATTFPASIYFTGTNGDFYVNDGAGNQVRMTSAGAVNVASAGAISSTGSPAYGALGVELRWDGADLEFEARAGAGADEYADIRLDDVILNDGSSHFLRVTAPSMVADYTLTLPSAVPATSNSVLTMDITGVLAASSTPTLTSLTTTAAISAGTTLGVTGATTLAALSATTGAFSSTLTMAVNQNIVMSGTGYVQHGTRQFVIPGVAFGPEAETVDFTRSNGYITHNTNASDVYYFAPLILPVGARVTNIRWLAHNGSSVLQREWGVYYADLASTSSSAVENDTDTSSGIELDFSNATDFDIFATRRYFLAWRARTSGDSVRSCLVDWHMP